MPHSYGSSRIAFGFDAWTSREKTMVKTAKPGRHRHEQKNRDIGSKHGTEALIASGGGGLSRNHNSHCTNDFQAGRFLDALRAPSLYSIETRLRT
jgi:hypothetical protein